MKHAKLRSIAHNLADSFASGMGFPIGYYVTDVFGEAQKAPGRFITADFLKGDLVAGSASLSLARAVRLYSDALVSISAKHGVSVQDFRMLIARFSTSGSQPTVLITIEDSQGRRSTDEYVGIPLRHIKTVDGAGRIRTLRKPK